MHQGLDGTHRQRGDTSHRSPDPPGAEPPPAAARLANGDGGAETQRPVKSSKPVQYQTVADEGKGAIVY